MKRKLLSLMLFAIASFTLAQTYCSPTFTNTNTSDGHISSFFTTNALTNINNSSGLGITSQGYSDYTNLSVIIEQGSNLNLSVGLTWVGTHFLKIWIDTNQNGIFETSEIFFSDSNGTSGGQYTETILTNSIDSGTYRMRILVHYFSYDDSPCGSAHYGEAEDYTLVVNCPFYIVPPTGEANQTFTAGQTLADLIVNGNNLVWYSDSALTTTIPTTTVLVNGTTYYVVEEVGGCKSSALAITVTDCATLVSTPTGATTQTRSNACRFSRKRK